VSSSGSTRGSKQKLDSCLRRNDRKSHCDPRESGDPLLLDKNQHFNHPNLMNKEYYIYILASKKNGTLYVGVSSDLVKRIYEHKNNLVDGFTKTYSVHDLVYYESTQDVNAAIIREKQLKKWKREWKINLIEKDNPEWIDLYYQIM
jgi:putative endonuclease